MKIKLGKLRSLIKEVLLKEESTSETNLAITLNGDWYDINNTPESEEPVGGIMRNGSTLPFKVWFKYLGVTKTSRFKNIKDAKGWVLHLRLFAIWSDEISIITRIFGPATEQSKYKSDNPYANCHWKLTFSIPFITLFFTALSPEKARIIMGMKEFILTKKDKEHLELENWLLYIRDKLPDYIKGFNNLSTSHWSRHD